MIGSYSHLRDQTRSDDALLILRKVASMVKPIMRARAWKVSELAEFYPDDQRLLGECTTHVSMVDIKPSPLTVARPQRERRDAHPTSVTLRF